MRLKQLIVFFSITFCALNATLAQKFSPAELKEDLAFIQRQIFDAQANPFTELTKDTYEKVFARIDKQIKDSLTILAFYRLVKPTISWTSDEHAAISLPENVKAFDDNALLLPFTIKKQGNEYVVDTVLAENTGLSTGAVIQLVNNQGIDALVKNCATYTTGFTLQRTDKAMKNFGYLYSFANGTSATYAITLQNGHTIAVPGISADTWLRYLNNNNGNAGNCPNKISYTKYGNTGYINTCSFSTHSDSEFAAVSRTIDSIFMQVQKDSVQKVVIDVSHNGGGNSAVGDMLIAWFYDKPYHTYQCNWKRSDEYLKTIKGWGVQNSPYERMKPGETLHYDSYTITPEDRSNRFKGKVFVVVGDGTFSSAIMFATIIKDNNIAPLAGKTPANGHPTHFGEMYSTETPHTHLAIRFGVKEWIRPAGKTGENVLTPDIPVNLGEPVDVAGLIGVLAK